MLVEITEVVAPYYRTAIPKSFTKFLQKIPVTELFLKLNSKPRA